MEFAALDSKSSTVDFPQDPALHVHTATAFGLQKEALDNCYFINASADQVSPCNSRKAFLICRCHPLMTLLHWWKKAYLETDPVARTTKDEYVLRYQQFARDDLERALQKYDALHRAIGA